MNVQLLHKSGDNTLIEPFWSLLSYATLTQEWSIYGFGSMGLIILDLFGS